MIAQGHIEPSTAAEAEAAHEARILAHAERLRGVWQSAEAPKSTATDCLPMLTAAAGAVGRTLAQGFGIGGGAFRPGPASALSWKWLAVELLRRRGCSTREALGWNVTTWGKLPRYRRVLEESGWTPRMEAELLDRERAVRRGETPPPVPVSIGVIFDVAAEITGHSREAMLEPAGRVGYRPGGAYAARWASIATLDALGGSVSQQLARCNVPGCSGSHKAEFVAKVLRCEEGRALVGKIRDAMVWGWP